MEKRINQHQVTEIMHIPVLLEETTELLAIKEDGTYIDATVGCGGHAKAILQKLANGTLIGIDRDSLALKCAESKLEDVAGRVKLVKGNFAHLERISQDLNIGGADGILFDLGLSSLQLDSPRRGFSFQQDGPLDMRFDPESGGACAKEIVNNYPQSKLVQILTDYGQVRWAKRIAKKIVNRRKKEEFETTTQLVEAIKEAIPKKAQYKMPIHPATRTFQALRIQVNNELDNLKRGLSSGFKIMKSKGIIAVISYHSLEDSIVKQFFKEKATDCICPPDLPECICDKVVEMDILTKSPVTPSPKEIERNPKSRSAKLRAAKKLR